MHNLERDQRSRPGAEQTIDSPEPPVRLPNIEAPKGGGAIRGISERFRANAATGTGTVEVNVGLSPGRGGFDPQLVLAYDSGAGNGPCGLGWTCGAGSIGRKTSRGVPVYRDDADTFTSGGEDLVRVGAAVGVVEGAIAYRVQRYRPRVERAFVRIERWREEGRADPGHWRTYSPEDVCSIFGRTNSARIFDPARPSRVFEWLLEEQWDGRGSAIRYVYKREDLAGVDLARASEAHRRDPNGPGAGGHRYLKRILYGNATPLNDRSLLLEGALLPRWRFEAVFDYGEHADDRSVEAAAWPVRADPFSRHRAGFELRMYRLLRRILMFHRFPELGPAAEAEGVLVRSTSFTYEDDPVASRLVRVEQRGHRDGATLFLPPVDFEYSRAEWNDRLRVVHRDVLHPWPTGLDGQRVQWIDLDGEGLPGALMSSPEAWWYERPEGGGRLGPVRLVQKKPAAAAPSDSVHQLLDLQGDGRLDLVRFVPPLAGYCEQTATHGGGGRRAGFDSFRAFESLPRVDFTSPNLRFLDTTGDGLADIVISEGDLLVCHRSRGAQGFEEAIHVPVPRDERLGPRVVFADAASSIFLADMTGDGLADIVRVEHRRICYWPNLGHGRFGPRVMMSSPPVLDTASGFDGRRVRLADLDGSGPADLVYLHANGVIACSNEAGNGWSAPRSLSGLPLPHRLSDVDVVDLLGRGTACLVWSGRMLNGTPRLSYVDPFGRDSDDEAPPSAYKPHLLVRVINNLGAETRIRYTPSTKFYLEARGTPNEWVTRLHFPVQVVDRVEHEDFVANVRLVQRFAYHHGYYDPEEREFNGFGYVEVWDEEIYNEARGSGSFDDAATGGRVGWVPPIYTRTWFHTGASRGRNTLEPALLARARANPAGLARLAATVLPADLATEELADACRALRGQLLRQEVYGLDGSPSETEPYLITESQVEVRQIERVFTVVPRESRVFHTERDGVDARVVRDIVLEIRPDDARYGHVRRTASIAFGRDQGPAAQMRTWVQTAEMLVGHHDMVGGAYRIRQPVRARSWDLEGVAVAQDTSLEDLRVAIDAAPRRLLTDTETLYWNAALDAERPPGESDPRGFVRRVRSLAVPVALQNALYGASTPGYAAGQWIDGGHELIGGDVWAQSAVVHYLPAAQFNLPDRTVDPFGHPTRVGYDPHALFAVRQENALGHVVTADIGYHALAPREVIDENLNHVEVAHDALGAITRIARKGKALGGGQWEGRTLAAPNLAYTHARSEWLDHRRPNYVRAEVFASHDPADPTSIVSFTYADGLGNEVLTKAQAQPGRAPLQDPVTGALILDGNGDLQFTPPEAPRWVGSGRVVLNGKGEPLKQYEAYFSSVSAFDDEPALIFESPAAVFHYDPLGRLTRTQYPDGTETRVGRFTWMEALHDRSDTVIGSRWAADAAASADPEAQRALALSVAHAGTPTLRHLDALGHMFRVEEDNGVAGAPDLHSTSLELDIQGRVLRILDARGNAAGTTQHDLLGRVLRDTSADGGTRWTVPAVDDQPVRVWTERQHAFEHTYDALRRPLIRRELAVVRTLFVYGDVLGTAAAQAANLLGQVHQVYDGAGARVVVRNDFDGHQLETHRRLRAAPLGAAPRAEWAAYALGADWSVLAAAADLAALAAAADQLLEAETFIHLSSFDALGRPVTTTAPDGSATRRQYAANGRLDRIDVRPPSGAWTPYVAAIAYDAQGRRERIRYGQGVETSYVYHPTSRRLTSLHTERPGGRVLQDLRYTHDAFGDIITISDGAQPETFFDNAVVSADRYFEYDARHRLVRAEGRCHPGQQPTGALPPNRRLPHPNDATTLQRYTESYVYDSVGNIMEMAHRCGLNVAWRRRYQYALTSNRLLSTSRSMAEPDLAPYEDPAAGPRYLDVYAHDVHGNMTTMPGLGSNVWSSEDRLVDVSLGGGGDAFYSYDDTGDRVRKIIRRANGADIVERIYLEGWETYRRRLNGDPEEEIETLHVMDDARRIALIETRVTQGGIAVANPQPRPRYQLDDHLGTCALEIGGTPQALVLTYEEHYPYGATSYRATRAGVDLSPKRYRYTTKERDEETGLDYFGDRYYASWLGRWTAADPDADPEQSLYIYGALSPQGFVDPDGGKEIPIGFIYTLTRVLPSGASETYVGKAADLRQRLLAKGTKEHHHFRDLIRRADTRISARAVYADLGSALGKGATRQALDKARDAALLVAEQDEINRVRSTIRPGDKLKNVVEALKDESLDVYRRQYKVRSASGVARVLKVEGQALQASRLALLARGKPTAYVLARSRLKSASKGITKKVPVVTLFFVGSTFYAEGAEASVVEAIDSFNPLGLVGLSLKDKYDQNKEESKRRWDELLNDMAMMEIESIVLEDAIAEYEDLPELEKEVDRVIEEFLSDYERGLQWERENIPAPAYGR